MAYAGQRVCTERRPEGGIRSPVIPTPGPKDTNGFNTNETGAYTVHENCTGEAEIDFPTPPGGTSGAVIKFFFVISGNGRQLNTIVTSITPPNSSTPVPANIHSDAVKVH
jgi:hypothetical protein